MLRDRASDELGTAAGVVVMACTEENSYETGEACQGEVAIRHGHTNSAPVREGAGSDRWRMGS